MIGFTDSHTRYDTVSQYLIQATAAYLTVPVAAEIRDILDKACAAYTAGMDRAGYAGPEKDRNRQRELWASALTYYAQAEMYAQMAKTTLLRAKSL